MILSSNTAFSIALLMESLDSDLCREDPFEVNFRMKWGTKDGDEV
ncbi:hypothetical protein IC582_022429 [Cucumis melo]